LTRQSIPWCFNSLKRNAMDARIKSRHDDGESAQGS
jgi:hypothetical protein